MEYKPLVPHILVRRLPLPESTIIHIQRPKQLKCEIIDIYEGCTVVTIGQTIIVPVQQVRVLADSELGFVDVSEEGANVVVVG